ASAGYRRWGGWSALVWGPGRPSIRGGLVLQLESAPTLTAYLFLSILLRGGHCQVPSQFFGVRIAEAQSGPSRRGSPCTTTPRIASSNALLARALERYDDSGR